jgi:hypothetical protein
VAAGYANARNPTAIRHFHSDLLVADVVELSDEM